MIAGQNTNQVLNDDYNLQDSLEEVKGDSIIYPASITSVKLIKQLGKGS